MTTTAAPAAWAAPTADGPVRGRVSLPGSKSLTNRLLVLGALAETPSVLREPLEARDTALMAGGLRALGVAVHQQSGVWRVVPGRLRGPAAVDVGNAGTVARFLPPVAALSDGAVAFDGDPRVRERPLAGLLAALRTLGASIDDAEGRLPITVQGTGGLAGGSVTVDASGSSQLLSGLLLAGPRMRAGLTVTHRGGPLPSVPHLEITVACLRAAGAVVDDATTGTWRVEPGPLLGRDITVEPDLSNAAPFLAAAAATGGEVGVTGWPAGTTQPGRLLGGLLERMGCRTSSVGGALVVTGPDRLLGLDADLAAASELVPTLVALAVLARTPSRLRGVGHMRGHETDRLRALAEELGRLGARVTETADGLQVEPAPLHAPDRPLDPRSDHRLATCYAVLGLVVPGVHVLDVATVGKTMPDFTDRWAALVG